MADPPRPSRIEATDARDERERRFLPRHREGDDSAFGELLEAYRAPVFGYLVRCGVEPTARDDLFQEIFLKIHLASDRYDPERPLKPWLFTIVVNTVRNWFRDTGRDKSVPLTEAVERKIRDAAPNPGRAAEGRETAHWLEAALQELPLPHRKAILLTCVEGMDQKAASQALGVPLNTLKTHVRRGRIAMARALAARRALPEGKEQAS